MKKILSLLVAVLFISGIAKADTATGNFTAKAILMTGVSIFTDEVDGSPSDLDFGTIHIDATADSYSLDFADNVTTGGTHSYLTGARSGVYKVMGPAGTDVTFTASTATLVGASGTTTLTFTPIIDLPTLTLSGASSDSITVGGTLDVPINATATNYSGTFTLTATY